MKVDIQNGYLISLPKAYKRLVTLTVKVQSSPEGRKVKISLTKHPRRPHRTQPQTDKYHRWRFPSGPFQLSPLLLQMTQRDRNRNKMNWEHFFGGETEHGHAIYKNTLFLQNADLEGVTFEFVHLKLKGPSPSAFPVPEPSPIPCLISPIIPTILIDLYRFSFIPCR